MSAMKEKLVTVFCFLFFHTLKAYNIYIEGKALKIVTCFVKVKFYTHIVQNNILYNYIIVDITTTTTTHSYIKYYLYKITIIICST